MLDRDLNKDVRDFRRKYMGFEDSNWVVAGLSFVAGLLTTAGVVWCYFHIRII